MKFTLNHQPDGVGFQIDVNIDPEGGEIATVETTLDGVDLGGDQLTPHVTSYARTFRHVGSLTPGDDHHLSVAAHDGAGKRHSTVSFWTD